MNNDKTANIQKQSESKRQQIRKQKTSPGAQEPTIGAAFMTQTVSLGDQALRGKSYMSLALKRVDLRRVEPKRSLFGDFMGVLT